MLTFESDFTFAMSLSNGLSLLQHATEMAKALVSNAFDNMKVRKIVACTTPHNIASVKVLAKSGFRWVCRDHESCIDLFEILRS